MRSNRFIGIACAAGMVALLIAPGVRPPGSGAAFAGVRAKLAGDVSVTASVNPARVYLGDSVALQIKVAGSNTPEQPDLAGLKDFNAAFQGGSDSSSHSVMIINGRRSETSFNGYVFNFQLTPLKKGNLTLPPIAVKVEGKEYRTDPVNISVVEPGAAVGFTLRLEAEKSRAYVGEPIRVRLTWYLTGEAKNGSFSMPDAGLGSAYDLLAPPDPRPAGTSPRDQRFRDFQFLGKSAVAVIGPGVLDGQPMNTISVERILVPKKAGKLEIGPARVAFDAVVGRRAASWMDGPWDDLSKTERRVAASNPLDIDVLSLPEPKPANFMGLVGAYSIQASADVTDVHVGDPITLTIRVTGPKPLERVPPIDLDAQRDLGAWFKVPPEPALPTVAGGAAVYTQTIRAATERVKEIPPIELPYFDVAKGEYAVAKSNAIPLNVTPTTEVTLKGMEDKPAESTAPEQPGGLAPMIRTTDVLADQRFDFLRALESPGWIAVLGAPVAVYALAGLVVGVRRRALRDPAAVRRRRALLRAKRRLRQASRLSALNGPGALAAAANAASGAVRGYIADMLGAPDGSQTSGELIARLRAEKGTGATAEPGTPIDQGAELLEKCDAVLFAGAGVATPAALVEEAGGVVDRLHGFMEAKS